MSTGIQKKLWCIMTLMAMICGLIFMPMDVRATETTPDDSEQSEQEEQILEPMKISGSILEETMEATEGCKLEAPVLTGITVEQDDDSIENEDEATWSLKAKFRWSGAVSMMDDAEIIIGEKEPDGKVYEKAYVYVNSDEIRDAAATGSIKIKKTIGTTKSWKPTAGQELVIGIYGYTRLYDENGQYKSGITGYQSTYKVTAGKKRIEILKKKGKLKLTLRFKNHNNRQIYQSKNYYFAEGETYTIPAYNFNGYTLAEESQALLSGTMGAEDATLDMAYTGNTVPVVVSYTAYVDGASKEIATGYNVQYKVGDSYSVDSPEVTGYKLQNEYYGKNVNGVVPAGGVNESVSYRAITYLLTINHWDENGNELYPQADEYSLTPGTEYSYDIRTFTGYTPTEGFTEVERTDSEGNTVTDDSGNAVMVKKVAGVMPEKDQEVTVRYAHNKAYAKIAFSFVGLDSETQAPEGMPADPEVIELNSWEDCVYDDFPVIEGWTLVANSSYDEYFDANKNCLTIPGDSWNLLNSSEAQPFTYNMVYKQKCERTVRFRYDDPKKTEAIAPSQTYTLLAGQTKDVANPLIDGYICSKGVTTTLKANGGSDVDVYYTPYTEENGWRIVEGIPGEVQFDTANWNPERPNDPYKATLSFAWTSNLDTDEESVWSSYSTETKVYVGGEYVGTLDNSNQYTFFTDDAYFVKNHNEYQVTLYQQRTKNAYYGYDSDVYVKSEWTLHLPENPVVAEKDDKSIYKVVSAGAEVSAANMEAYSNTYKTFKFTFDAGSSYDEINVGWSVSAEDVNALGATAIDKNHHVLIGTTDGDALTLERNGLLGVYDYSIQAGGLESDVTEDADGSAYYTLDNVPLGSLVGTIGLEGWYHVGNGWIHVTGSTERPTEIMTAETDNKVTATSCVYDGYGRRHDWVDGAYTWRIQWSDNSNNYKVRELDKDYYTGEYKEENVWWQSAGYADFGNGALSYSSYSTYAANAVTPVCTNDGVIVGYLGVDYSGENGTSGERYDSAKINSETGVCTYSGTVYISHDNYMKYKDETLHFTKWNTAIGTASENEKDEAGNDLYAFTYHNGDICQYRKDSADEYTYAQVLKNSTTTVSFTLGDTGSETIAATASYKPTVDTESSSLDKNSQYTIQLSVDAALATALTNSEQVRNIQVYMISCDGDEDAMPELNTGVYGQGWDVDPSVTVVGTTCTLKGTFTRGDELATLIPGGKYKAAVLMDGYEWVSGTENNGNLNNANYYEAEASAVLVVPKEEEVVSRTLESLEITSAEVERTYEDPETGELYPQLSLAWKTTFTGDELTEDDMNVYSRQRYDYYGGEGDVQVIVSVFDSETGEDIDYFTSGNDSTQRTFTINAEGGTYNCWFVGSGTSKYLTKLNKAYQVSVTYKYKTSDKYGNTAWKTKTYSQAIRRNTGTATGSAALQVDNSGNALIRVVADSKLYSPTATIWKGDEEYGSYTLQAERDSSSESDYTKWYAWTKLGDVDAEELSVSITAEDYDANTFVDEKYPAVAKDFVNATYARQNGDSFGLVYKLDIPNSSFRPSTTFWRVSGKSDVPADEGAEVTSEWQKISVYSGDVMFKDTEYADSVTGLYLNKFATLAGKTVQVKVSDSYEDYVFTSSKEIAGDDAVSGAVTITSAEFDINGNVTVTGTYDENVVSIGKYWNTVKLTTIGPDGERQYRSDNIGDDVEIDQDKHTFTYSGTMFYPSGNSILGYTLREFSLLSDTDFEIAVTLNGIPSAKTAFTYKDGVLAIPDSRIAEMTEGEDAFLMVTLPRGYFTNTVDISGVITRAANQNAGLKIASDEDDIEFTFDAAAIASMAAAEEGEPGLLAVTKYTDTVPEHVTKSGLKTEAAYEIALSRTYTGKAKVRVISETALAEGGIPTVYYVSKDGTTEKMATTYSINQYDEVESEFETPHCSTFVVVYEGQNNPVEDNVTITFDANGGTGVMDPQLVKKGVAAALKANTFTRQGYTFAGWATAKAATAAEYADQATATFNADITLYAVWTADSQGQGGNGGQTPTTEAPATTEAPKTEAPTTEAPRTEAPTTEAPTTEAPTTEAPTTEAPTTEAPTTEAPRTEAPATTEAPKTEATATTEAPKTETPAVTGTTVTDTTSSAEYVVTSEAGTEPAVEYKGTDSTSEAEVTIPDAVTVDGVTYKVTSVAAEAFKDDTTITTVTIGSNVETIEESAFSGCTQLTSVTIPESVTTISENAFSGCTKLASVTIPESVTTISDGAFSGCTKLKTANIGTGVTEIGAKAFSNCTSLTKVTIPSSVTTIGDQAFSNNKKLKTAKIGNNVTEIGTKAFSNCTSLTKINVPAKVTKIGTQAFAGDKKLKTITIKSTKLTSKSISKNAFKGITEKTTIKVPKNKKKEYTILFRKKGLSKKVKIK